MRFFAVSDANLGRRRTLNPFQHFLSANVDHPEIDAMLAALERGDDPRSERPVHAT